MEKKPFITTIAKAGPGNPRNDTASIAALKDGSFMVVWHEYEDGPAGGSDFGRAHIACKLSNDKGLSWHSRRTLVESLSEDLNVQAPALCSLSSGELLLICLRAHEKDSSTMLLFRSHDDGKTFTEEPPIWSHSPGQWLQGGAASLIQLSGGRLLLPFHGGTGDQGSQHNVVRCFYSDDNGRSWRMAGHVVDLPMRGAMESSVTELPSGRLIMSLRTQLGSVFLCSSDDLGETWDLPQASTLKASESCTCIRCIPGTGDLLLLWDDSMYDPSHHHYGIRTPLSAALSHDEGATWKRLGNIAGGDFAYFNLGCTMLEDRTALVTFGTTPDPEVRDGVFVPLNSRNRQNSAKLVDLKFTILTREWIYR